MGPIKLSNILSSKELNNFDEVFDRVSPFGRILLLSTVADTLNSSVTDRLGFETIEEVRAAQDKMIERFNCILEALELHPNNLDILNLSSYIIETLEGLNIDTVDKLVELSARDLMAIDGFGIQKIATIKEALRTVGLSLREPFATFDYEVKSRN